MILVNSVLNITGCFYASMVVIIWLGKVLYKRTLHADMDFASKLKNKGCQQIINRQYINKTIHLVTSQDFSHFLFTVNYRQLDYYHHILKILSDKLLKD